MDEGNARKVALVLGTADGYCPNCTTGLAEEAGVLWPEFPWFEWVFAAQLARVVPGDGPKAIEAADEKVRELWATSP